MDELIKELGEHFRGLWQTKEFDGQSTKTKLRWWVTIQVDRDLFETSGYSTHIEALQNAVRLRDSWLEKYKK